MERNTWFLSLLLLTLIGFSVSGIQNTAQAQVPLTQPWSTYFGGSGADGGAGIILDSDGNVIVAGTTTSLDLPVSAGLQTAHAGSSDAFVAKFTASGSLLWARYFGGSGDEANVHIAKNSDGTCTITGSTSSSNLPVSAGAFQTVYKGNGDAFLAHFGTDGVLLWATYYGGNKVDQMPCITSDAFGNVFLALNSSSKAMPVTPGVFCVPGSLNIAKFSESGTLLWATQHGDGTPWGGIATDVANDMLVTGMTGTGFPVSTGAWQSVCAGGNDAFIVKYSGSGARLWSTYYGGSQNDWARGITTDSYGNVAITGYTWSADLPVSLNAFQSDHADGGNYEQDAYLAKFSSAGMHLWSTYYGGIGNDYAYSLTADKNDNITFSGYTTSSNFPVSAQAFQGVSLGGSDGIVVQFSASGSRNWATRFGGSGNDYVTALTSDAAATILFTGQTGSTDIPTLNAWQSTFAAGGSDAFIAQLDAGGMLPGFNAPPVAVASATPLQGTAPLTVSFSAAGSYDPESTSLTYAWDFGDGGSSTLADPSHIYQTSGAFTASLTVTDQGSVSATATVQITVLSTGSYLYVFDQVVTRVQTSSIKWKGHDVVTIYDQSDLPVSGAVVTATYAGPTSGTVSGTTGANGTVILETGIKPNPVGTWCFTVTDVQRSGSTFNSSLGVITACEGGITKVGYSHVPGMEVRISPNPVTSNATFTMTLSEAGTVTLRVYDLLGRTVATLSEGYLPRGAHCASFDASNLPGGVYIYSFEVNGRLQTGMVPVVK